MENFIKPEGQTTSDNFIVSELEKDFLLAQSGWGEMSDEDINYISKKGFKSPAELLKSYRELEKSYSSKISIPKDGDKEAFDKLYSRLGMPQQDNEFEIQFSTDIDETVGNDFKKICLENNILPPAAQALYDWYAKKVEDNIIKEDEEFASNSEKEFLSLKEEWGNNYNRNLEFVKRGLKLFTNDIKTINKIEKSFGTKALVEVFAKLGQVISEDNSISFGRASKASNDFSPVEYFREMFNE